MNSSASLEMVEEILGFSPPVVQVEGGWLLAPEHMLLGGHRRSGPRFIQKIPFQPLTTACNREAGEGRLGRGEKESRHGGLGP